ncbi:MAG: dCTP deaminase [Candidatus Zambryskibacteria bacterium RIFCSPHIGHO2_01_FULL_44_22b]|uniref:dCTP deaminase n=2 Tax=Candidatus Zambryskiibacteriota TaxID=1817925 RepID=A0A1G2SZV0_9BACT|nr:MAG: dCTP deaminase [Candidatus Zambryskibacteria bacterium RIFCSPHIGHO2_01_FULL_44_22b]OHB05067.1 MAG: dCTP deaminase [Candidatus Zambryskibacteria bacterium RIFCSPLOWO2_01_FULL_45_43]
MYLSDIDIKKAVKDGDIILSDFDEKRLQPASYDILLGNKFMLTEAHSADAIDPVKKKFAKTREVLLKKGETFTLHPGVSILGISIDYFGSRKYLLQLHGKSSLARVGLMVHNTAGLINPGHFLCITFELCNLNSIPIILTPGMPIAQLTFSKMLTEPATSHKKASSYVNDHWNIEKPPTNLKKKVKNFNRK